MAFAVACDAGGAVGPASLVGPVPNACGDAPLAHSALAGEQDIDGVAPIAVHGVADGLGVAVLLDDLDGNGVAEIIVGTNGVTGFGAVHLFECAAPGVYTSIDATRTWTGPGPERAFWVASADDQDGDGVRDLLVSAATSLEAEGVVRIVSGAAPTGGLDPAIATWTHAETAAIFGSRMNLDSSGLGGDATGDGYADVLVQESGSGVDPGVIWVVAGPVAAGDHEILDVAHASLTLDNPDGDNFGISYAGLDWNSDGVQDLVASSVEEAEPDGAGIVRVFLGPLAADLGKSDAEATVAGDAVGQQFGFELRAGGDLDGDGSADLLVEGFNLYEPRPVIYGFAPGGAGALVLAEAIFSITADDGHANWPVDMASLDGDLDGSDDLVVSMGSSADANGTTWVLHGPLGGTVPAETGSIALVGAPGVIFTGYALSTGDIDGDGHADLVVSDSIFGYPGVKDGAAWVLYGGLL